MNRWLRVSLTCASVGLLAGCKASYEVNVRNQSDQPITAEMRVGSEKGRSEVLIRERVAPSDRATLGPERVGGLKRVFLSVDFQGNVDLAETTRLRRGMSAVNVRRADEGAQGTIELEVSRP